jgi:hypothetical protein
VAGALDLLDEQVESLGGAVAGAGGVMVEDLRAPAARVSPRDRTSGTESRRHPWIALSRSTSASAASSASMNPLAAGEMVETAVEVVSELKCTESVICPMSRCRVRTGRGTE